ncbi:MULTISPECIES: HAAS signaling domain-containing protein [unclassified Streptomyces]|uniref:HAAS signaling domain-containing protein n=1 Tax=unclassified Streptomyces TaxID=2593676 RepID=UPI00380EB400
MTTTEKSQNAGNGAGDALVRDYLAAVGRETSALPAERRQELLADLAEHIEIALAEGHGSSRDVLRELGDPRTIAATALQESGLAPGAVTGAGSGPGAGTGKAPGHRSPAWLVVLLPVLALGLGYLWAPLGFALKVAGAVVLFRSRYWTSSQKWTGFGLTVLAPSLTNVAWFLLAYPNDPAPYAYWTAIVATVVMTLAGAGRLWQVRSSADATTG